MKFFEIDDTKQTLRSFISLLKTFEVSDKKYLNIKEDCLSLLNIMHNAPQEWDKFTQFNIGDVSGDFFKSLNTRELDEEKLHFVYALAIRFLIEFYITTDISFDTRYIIIKDNAYNTIDIIKGSDSRWHLHFAFNGMSLELVKNIIGHDDIAVFRDFAAAKRSAEQLKLDWDTFLKEKDAEVKKLEKTLTDQKHSYQFVLLNKGFQSLLEQKVTQLTASKMPLFLIGLLLPAFLIFEMFFWAGDIDNSASQSSMLRYIPGLSLTLILVYYFRVALQNYQSIKAQILQIEFRMTLCGFIQSYAEYSSNIKDKNPSSLSKFEDVIFSNIMPTENKIPSTFDGIDQVSALITSIKGGRDNAKP